VLAAYATGHGYGHLTRLCEVLRAVRAAAPDVSMTLVGQVPEPLARRAGPPGLAFRAAASDVGLVQRDALSIDEAATAERCRAFDATWKARVDEEAAFLRTSGARAVLADVPALAFEAAARAGIPALGLANFSWDWVYRHLATRQPSLAASADRAARAYARADLLLELPFAGDLSAFPRRDPVGLVARRPRIPRPEARRRLGLDARPTALVSFGGTAGPSLDPASLARERDLRFLLTEELPEERLASLGLDYPDLIGAVDVVVTKPGYGTVSDAIGAGTRLVYTDRGDFPEYSILVRDMVRWLACEYLPSGEVRAGRIAGAVRRVLERPMPPAPEMGGAARAAARVLAALG
jgi:L-arabinokinase